MTEKTKYLRCIRLDESDSRIFERAAVPGEAAVSGAFLFQGLDIDKLAGPRLQAFRNGFLGVESMGWCTLVTIAETDNAELEATMISQLAQGLTRDFGAPDIASVMDAASEEVRDSRSLCQGDVDTLLAVQRTHDGDDIREQVHAVPRDGSGHGDLKIWDWIDEQS